jgi:hypothetical protein
MAPPAVPTHLTTTSDAQIAETNRQHKIQKEEFILFHNANTALHNLLIAAVPPMFLADQHHPMTGFGNKTVLQLLTYLQTTFDSISEKELEQNTARMQLQWTPPLHPLKPYSFNLRITSLSPPLVKMPLPNQRSSVGPTTLLRKQDGSTLPVGSGAKWIPIPNTGTSSKDISRPQTRMYGASTQ